MKKKYFIILALTLMAVLLSACAASDQPKEQEEKITIVGTTFSQYDWVRQIIGTEKMERFELSFLLDNRVDLHSYNPSVQDITRVKTADVFIYVGGHSDSWADDILAETNTTMIKLNLLELLGDDALIFGDFCDTDCDEEHEHDKPESSIPNDEPGVDEHICLSLRFAKTISAAIAGILSEVDPANAGIYQENAELYINQLSILDAEYQAVVDTASVKTLVFADRFPFRYMMTDYGLTYYAAFSGCSAETEASFITVISLANRLNQLGLRSVMVTETSDQSIARTVIESTNTKNQQILVLDSLKSVTAIDAQNGVTYLSIMESNLEILREALRR